MDLVFGFVKTHPWDSDIAVRRRVKNQKELEIGNEKKFSIPPGERCGWKSFDIAVKWPVQQSWAVRITQLYIFFPWQLNTPFGWHTSTVGWLGESRLGLFEENIKEKPILDSVSSSTLRDLLFFICFTSAQLIEILSISYDLRIFMLPFSF